MRTGATTVTIVGRDGHADSRIRASGLGSGRSTTGITCRSSRASRRPCARCCPSLLRDLGAPFPAVWDQLHAAHGPADAARLFAKVLGQLDTHGADVVVPALRAALVAGTPLLLALTPGVRHAGCARAGRRPGRTSAISRSRAAAPPTTTAGSSEVRA